MTPSRYEARPWGIPNGRVLVALNNKYRACSSEVLGPNGACTGRGTPSVFDLEQSGVSGFIILGPCL